MYYNRWLSSEKSFFSRAIFIDIESEFRWLIEISFESNSLIFRRKKFDIH